MIRALVALSLWLALPAIASAHPEVERARQLVLDGDYDAARPALDAALGRDDLDRDDLIALLEARALLFHGLAEHDARDRVLRSLAAFDPTHRFGPRFPPDLASRSVEIGREMGGRLRVVLSEAPSPVGLRLEARVDHDPEGLVRSLRYRVFDVTSGQWQPATPPIEAAAGREILVFVEAIGPGGAVVAREGSSDAPIRLRGPGPLLGPDEGGLALGESEGSSEGEEGFPDWATVLIVVGGVLVVAAIVGASIYAAETPRIVWQPTIPTEVVP